MEQQEAAEQSELPTEMSGEMPAFMKAPDEATLNAAFKNIVVALSKIRITE